MFKSNQARNRLLAASDHINTLRVVIVLLVLALMVLWWRNTTLQETRRFYIPPDLSRGVITDVDQVPLPTIYTFGYYIFQQLYRWRDDGEKDYPRQIYALQGFITPGCIEALKNDMNQKQQQGELRQRIRTVQEIAGQSYTPQRVLVRGDDTWTIWLDVNVKEYIGGHSVKDVMLRYSFDIARFDVDREVNPWGLALACDEGMRPQLLQDEDIGKPFIRSGAQP